jgi:tetraacyldisaccharide-1-P 4'-kinase
VAHRAAFPDHHRYTVAELETLTQAAGGAFLVTTEKDMMNLPAGLTMRIECIRITVEIENEPDLIRLIEGTK